MSPDQDHKESFDSVMEKIEIHDLRLPDPNRETVIYVCFDKNMEQRLFHMRSTAERHAIGEIDEYVKRKTSGP